jgi:hypothetical protein
MLVGVLDEELLATGAATRQARASDEAQRAPRELGLGLGRASPVTSYCAGGIDSG